MAASIRQQSTAPHGALQYLEIEIGRIAHETFIAAQGVKRRDYPFGHGREHAIGAVTLFASYHCSRYNTNTGVLTPEMFRAVFARVRKLLDT